MTFWCGVLCMSLRPKSVPLASASSALLHIGRKHLPVARALPLLRRTIAPAPPVSLLPKKELSVFSFTQPDGGGFQVSSLHFSFGQSVPATATGCLPFESQQGIQASSWPSCMYERRNVTELVAEAFPSW
jgi:hypothetical protein